MSWTTRIQRFSNRKGDRVNALRRNAAMLIDQGIALACWKMRQQPISESFDGTVRFGLVTVNFSTTRYLKLMLLTLAEQRELHRLSRVVIVDNDSRDGGRNFCRELAAQCPPVHLVENRYWVNHARGLRTGVAALDRIESGLPDEARSNVILACDTDIIFRNPDTLQDLARRFEKEDAVFAGELRHGLYPYPEAQASFFALRREMYGREDIRPFVHHGAPAWWLQRSLWQAGFTLTNFPSNTGGYILHRGRSGVDASRRYRPGDAHATAENHQPHFMGVSDGEGIWRAAEERFSDYLTGDNEERLIEHLCRRFST